jgi:hypothetical protein
LPWVWHSECAWRRILVVAESTEMANLHGMAGRFGTVHSYVDYVNRTVWSKTT